MNEIESTDLYIVLETPQSGAIEYLINGMEDSIDKALFHIPKSQNLKRELKDSNKIVFWDDENSSSSSIELVEKTKGLEELFLFFSPFLDLSDQFESVCLDLKNREELLLSRVISFIDADRLENKDQTFQSWIDATAHFSDVLCITNRKNQNGKSVGDLFKRYENMRYPMETYVISSTKRGKIANILNPTTRRISHIFDSSELLESQDTPLSDPYLTKLANGNRQKSIPIQFIR
ncbi:MAG: hypothetical protein CMI24_03720 [Opitutae bacterium]|nr:hypothetical protein [Opitutae bacterium]